MAKIIQDKLSTNIQNLHSKNLDDIEAITTISSISSTEYNDNNWYYLVKKHKLLILKYLSLLLIVVHNAGQILLGRYAMVRPGVPFLKTVAVVSKEIIEATVSLTLFFAFNRSLHSTKEHLMKNLSNSIRIFICAIGYALKNFLLYVAIDNLDAGTYTVIYQLNILTSVFFTIILLKRKFSILQWLGLVFLIGGIVVVQLSAEIDSHTITSNSNNATSGMVNETVHLNVSSNLFNETLPEPLPITPHEQSLLIGFTSIIVACILHGCSCVYFEKVLKESNTPLWLAGAQANIFVTIIGSVAIIVKDHEEVLNAGLFQGFDEIVWSVVLMRALGGLLFTFVIKYADNILRGFATGISIIVISVLSIFLFGIFPSVLFIIGATIVVSAVVLYSAFPYKNKIMPNKENN